MDIQRFSYQEGLGWSTTEFPKLDSEKTVVFIFGAPEMGRRSDLFEKIQKEYPKAQLIGCSSSGEIHGEKVLDHSLSIAVARFAYTDMSVVSVPIGETKDSELIGKMIGEKINKNKLSGCFVLSNGLKINGSALVKGIGSIIPKEIPITGGLAGDGSAFKQTWVYCNGKILFDHVVALGFYGNNIKISHGSRGGWDIFGPERIVTRSDKNILYELDGKPALKLYKEYLGDKASELPASGLLFPLQIRENRNSTRSLVRTILAVDEEKQGLIFAGDIPKGWLAQLMRANFDRLIEGAHTAASALNITEDPGLVIAISCVGRRLVLGERVEEEVEATASILAKSMQQVGFYSYGELSPFVKGDACELHNQTMTLTCITET